MAKLKPGYTVTEDGQVVTAAALTEAAPIEALPRPCNACGGAVHPTRERCLACQVRYGECRSISVADTLRQVEDELILQAMHPDDIAWFVEQAQVVLNQSSFLTADQALELVQPDYEALLQERAEAQIRQHMLVPLEEQLTPGEQRAKKKALEGEYLPPIVVQMEVRDPDLPVIEGEIVQRPEPTDAPPAVEEPVPGRRTKEQKLVSVTTALLPADKARLQARAEAAAMKIGPFLRAVIENYLVSCD